MSSPTFDLDSLLLIVHNDGIALSWKETPDALSYQACLPENAEQPWIRCAVRFDTFELLQVRA